MYFFVWKIFIMFGYNVKNRNMKKIGNIGFLLIIIFFTGIGICGCNQTPEQWKNSSDRYWDNNNMITEVNGCEYICFYRGDATWGAHKGDCKNPIHRLNNGTDVRFYGYGGIYEGNVTADSIVVRYDKKRTEYWNKGKIVYMVEIKGLGMLVDVDLKK